MIAIGIENQNLFIYLALLHSEQVIFSVLFYFIFFIFYIVSFIILFHTFTICFLYFNDL